MYVYSSGCDSLFQIVIIVDMSSLWSSASAGNYPEGFFSQLLYAEKAFNPEAAKLWGDSIKTLSLWLSAIYVILIFSGQQWMSNRPPFKLQIPLVLWNALLSVFSIAGALRTVPELYNGLVHYGWTHTVCDASFYHGPTGFWAFVFTMSKAYELGDTLFIVLRRQPLIFLHWYHHITVMVYTFYTYPEHVSAARWYIVMNYCIHSVMYTYYALRALRLHVPSFVRMSVTSLQILQMAVGLLVSAWAFVIKRSGNECSQSYTNIAAAVLMYASYLVLFAHFFNQQYAVPSRKKLSDLSDDKRKYLSEEEVKKLH